MGAGKGNGSPRDRGTDVTVLAVDDHDAFRVVIGELVGATAGFTLVGEACCGEDAIAAARELDPRLVLMDVNMPGMGGVEATRAIVREHPGSVVWLVSIESNTTLSELADSCGAEGFIRKDDLRPRLLRDRWAARLRTR